MTALSRRRLVQVGAVLAAAPAAGVPPGSAHAAPPAKRPKTLRVAFPAAETGFDPAQVQDLYSRTVIGHILDAPLEFDFMARAGRSAREHARCAARDFLRLPDLHIPAAPRDLLPRRSGVQGPRRELVAADYVYSWKRIYDPRWKSPMLFVLENSKVLGLSELRAASLKANAPLTTTQPSKGCGRSTATRCN